MLSNECNILGSDGPKYLLSVVQNPVQQRQKLAYFSRLRSSNFEMLEMVVK